MFLIILLFIFSLHAEPPPADITLLMIEVKYDEHHGVKVCELQPVCHSSFFGFDFVYEGYGLMGKNISSYLNQLNSTIWFMNPAVSHKPIREQFLAQGWLPFSNLSEGSLWRDAKRSPLNSKRLSDYSCIVYAKLLNTNESESFCTKFPGALLVDRYMVPYMYDKYAQNTLFTTPSSLTMIKPNWGLFNKTYYPTLADEICTKIDSPMLVIKPRHSDQGKGVIIVAKENLDATLQTIFVPDKTLINHSDRGYNYWANDLSSTFLVEEFIETTPQMIEGQLFDVTFRMAVALIFEQDTLFLYFLGIYGNLSDIPLDGLGNLNEKHKTSLLLPRTIKVSDPVKTKIYRNLAPPLLILYKKILGFDQDQWEENLDSSVVQID